MKIFKNKETQIEKASNNYINYRDLVLLSVNKPAEKGFTVKEMKDKFRLIDLFEKEQKEYEIEDADVETLKKCVSDMDGSWGLMHKDIIEFNEYITNL